MFFLFFYLKHIPLFLHSACFYFFLCISQNSYLFQSWRRDFVQGMKLIAQPCPRSWFSLDRSHLLSVLNVCVPKGGPQHLVSGWLEVRSSGRSFKSMKIYIILWDFSCKLCWPRYQPIWRYPSGDSCKNQGFWWPTSSSLGSTNEH